MRKKAFYSLLVKAEIVSTCDERLLQGWSCLLFLLQRSESREDGDPPTLFLLHVLMCFSQNSGRSDLHSDGPTAEWTPKPS